MKKYQIIYADPPWDVMRGCDWGSGGVSKPLPYPTMTIEQIKALPIKNIAEKDAHLYLWTINKYVRDAYDIAEAWGFKASCLITWCKKRHGIGLGGAFTQTTEFLLFCRRGTLKTQKRIDTTWFLAERNLHSRKPMMFMDMIVEVSGDLPRVELFSRRKALGWDCWGNEVDSDIVLPNGEGE